MTETDVALQTITFSKTADPLHAAGLASLVNHLESEQTDGVDIKMDGNSITLTSPDINRTLSEAYHRVCSVHFDISNKKAREEMRGVYYDRKADRFHRYPKVKQIGFAQLISDSRPMPKAEGEKDMSFKVIQLPQKLKKRLSEFEKTENIKIPDKDTIYIDDRNTAVPKLPPFSVSPGKRTCVICGEKYADTYETKKFSPFLGGASAGLSYVPLAKKPAEACWKCFYLNRMSVGKFLYLSESKGTKSQKLFCFSFNVDSLDGLILVNNRFLPVSFMLSPQQRDDVGYRTNFSLFTDNIKIIKCQHFHEIMLALLYTVYEKDQTMKPVDDDINWLRGIDATLRYETTVFYIFAKKFGQTVRPQTSGTYTEMSYLFRLFDLIGQKKLDIVSMFHAAVDYSSLSGKGANQYDIATADRDRWAKAVLSKQSIMSIIERIVCKNKNRSLSKVIDFIALYESYINYGGNMTMNDEMRDLAINLGSQIGMATLKGKNSKIGKAKIIQLRKSRNLKTFLDVLISLQFRYNLIISREMINRITEENFEYVRQFSIIQAMSIINSPNK
ncbi:MAG: hypothetical protein Q8M98_10105 [Candidatus Cloacimonadaceae bacterium]|nr:hypothetical protein [Candidatus Cloacimonadaceae bacterium]